jgi:hypothetical protein
MLGCFTLGFDAVQREKEKEFLGERRWPSLRIVCHSGVDVYCHAQWHESYVSRSAPAARATLHILARSSYTVCGAMPKGDGARAGEDRCSGI